MQRYTIFFLLCASVLYVNSSVRYDGYKVYEITPKNSIQLNQLNRYQGDSNYDFWMNSKRLGSPANLMVSPQAQEDFEADLIQNGIYYNVLIMNVQDTIDAEDARQNADLLMTRSQSIGDVTFTHYMRHTEINNYLKKLAENYPNIVRLVDFGRSYEGREMLLVQISTDDFTSNKPLILIDAAIHAREWVAPPTALYLIQQLVENSSNSDMYQNIDWAIIPVLNPDGYDFTQTNDRMWRKTRTPPNITTCWGVDGNRNCGFQWMAADGASANECAEDYAGVVPFSEIEIQHLRDYMTAHQNRIKLYLSIHSHGNWLLYPWGYTSELPDNAEELHFLAELVRDRIFAFNNTLYVAGPTSTTLYPMSGSTMDYAKGGLGIDLSYTIELPAGGVTGFNPTADRIIPIVREFFEGFKGFHQYMEEKFVTNPTNNLFRFNFDLHKN